MKYILCMIIILTLNYANANNYINQVIDDNPRTSISIQIKDLETGKEVYSYNPYRLMIPASVTKSFTAYAALEFLNSNFTYKTEILTETNNLYFKFSGDPTLTIAHLNNLVKKIPKNQPWNIFIDDFIFDQNYIVNGRSAEDNKFCFSAPTSAISININCFQAILKPGKYDGHQSILKINSKTFVSIDNQVMTKNDPSCSPHLIAKEDNSYYLSGCIDINSKEVSLKIAYQDPRLMIKSMITSLLNKNHIKYKDISFKSSPDKSNILATHTSKYLSIIIDRMHKDSDNLIANNIAKTIAFYYFKSQGTFSNAAKAIDKILSPKTNINFSEIRILDGSGESRYNLIAADQLVDLYISAYHNKNIWSYFYKSLPIIAIDGTLKHKFKDKPEFHGKIRAKTGHMGGVSTLAGLIDNKYAFAIMINGNISNKSNLSKLEDQLLTLILETFSTKKYPNLIVDTQK